MKQTDGFNFSDVVDDIQYRITSLNICNWGPFSGIWEAPVDAGGTLICGDTGAGKSSLVDSLQILLVKPAQASFNVAASGNQEGRQDRTLVTYVRGKYGDIRDGSKEIAQVLRPSATYSAVSADLVGTNGAQVTLMALFWVAGASTALSDIQRLYIVANRRLPIKEVLDVALSNGGIDRRAVDTHFAKEHPVSVHQKFDAYQAHWHSLLGIENPKGPALIIRAMGIKEIKDLTTLIRDFVLEPGRARADAEVAVNEFRELQAVQEELSDATRQQKKLAPLVDYAKTIQQAQEQADKLAAERKAVPAYYAQTGHALVTKQLEQLERRQATQALDVTEATKTKQARDRERELAHERYLLSGGDRIKVLEQRAAELNQQVQSAQSEARQCLQFADSIDLPGSGNTLDRDRFTAIRAKAIEISQGADSAEHHAAEAFGRAFSSQESLKKELAEVEEQKRAIEDKGRTSNIEERYQRIRDVLCDALNLEPESMVFLGEMVEVPSEHARWRGAIERALGGSRLWLLVNPDDRGKINAFINATHLGLDLRVIGVRDHGHSHPQFKRDGFLRILNWREHPYREFAKRELAKFDRSRVESVDDLNQTEYAMTVEGLTSLKKGTSEKRDAKRIDDQKQWFTGHSSAERLSVLTEQAKDLFLKLQEATNAAAEAQLNQRTVANQVAIAKAVARLNWADVDFHGLIQQRNELNAEIIQLKSQDEDLADAEAKLNEARQAAGEAEAKLQACRSALQDTERDIADAKKIAERFARDLPETPVAADVMERLEVRCQALTEDNLDRSDYLARQALQAIDDDASQVAGTIASAAGSATSIMASYKTKWPAVAGDLGSTMDSIEGYLEILARINKDRLPDLEERFQDKLNANSLQSLAQVQSAIDTQADDIEERIDDINRVLSAVDYVPGTLLKIQSSPLPLVDVNEFEQLIRRVRELSTETDAQARYEALQAVMERLAWALDPVRKDSKGSLRLLDARYRTEFSADKIDRQTGKVLETLGGTQGKSGGQKEMFSAFILGASLHYALTPAGGRAPRLSSVFLDEAFSRTSATMIAPVINVFRELKLHLNLMTPFKEMDTSEKATKAVIIVSHDDRAHLSRFKHITWERFVARRSEVDGDALPPGHVLWREAQDQGAHETA